MHHCFLNKGDYEPLILLDWNHKAKARIYCTVTDLSSAQKIYTSRQTFYSLNKCRKQ